MNTTKPMKPSDVTLAKTNSIPGEVFEAFNELITAHWDGRESRIQQTEALNLVLEKLNASGTKDVTEDDIFRKRWLDVEDSYRHLGWNVEYDKPGYNESYEASFKFSKRAVELQDFSRFLKHTSSDRD